MPASDPLKIRNAILVGHSGAGKTQLGDTILFKKGVTTRAGTIDDGSSYLAYDEESKERKTTMETVPFHIEHNGHTINLFDSPGMPDFTGPTVACLAGVEAAIVVISAQAGIGVNTRRMFNAAKEHGLARMIVVNRIGSDAETLLEVYNGIKESFGHTCHPINLPTKHGKRVIDVLKAEEGEADILDVAQCHTELLDSIVETDDELMEQYMETGAVPAEKLGPAIRHAVAIGHVVPILFTEAKEGVGIEELLDDIVTYVPSPVLGKQRTLITGQGDDKQETKLEPDASKDFVAQVIRVTADPKSNIRYSLARVFQGQLSSNDQLFVSGDRKGQRPGHLAKLNGPEHVDVEPAVVGDIIGFAKLELHVGDVLFSSANEGTIAMPKLPTPMFSLAIEPKSRGDADKISAALARYADEDPCFEYHRDQDTGELLMSGLGDQHLTVIRSKMKRYFKLEVETHPPKIPYRETIAGSAENVEYTHKKQAGGAGQYAKVHINLKAAERGEGYEFVDKIFGGSIDQQFRPSVDKGVREQMKRGVLAGYPVVDCKVELIDGKTHPVDSKDVAFQVAGRQAFKKAFMASKPILLEPIVHVDITVPADYVGDIISDVTGSKRGQIQGQDNIPGNQVIVRAEVPLAEVANYASQLKSVTGGQGSYMMEFSHYDIVPGNVQQQIVAAAEKKDDDDE